MSKILQFAVAILIALWFTSDVFAHENKDSSNLEEFDFYFDDKSLNESTQQSNPRKNETTEFKRKDKHESIDKPYRKDGDDYFSVGNLKRLIRYYISLLHFVIENDSQDAELLQDHKFGKESSSRNTKLETNRTHSTPRMYKSSNTENISDTEFKNSAGENNGEYYEEGTSFENSYKEESGKKTLKSNITRKPKVRNNGRTSGDQQRNGDDNQKLTSEDFRFHMNRANHSASPTEPVSDEFIDEYINPPTENSKSYEVPVANQPIFSNGRGNQTLVPTKESSREENVPKLVDRKLINPQNSDSDNTKTDMKTTSNKEVGKEEYPINEWEKSDNTNHKTFSNQNGEVKNKNVNETTAVENEQNYSPSNKSPHFINNKQQNNENSTSRSLPAEHTSKIPNGNSSSQEETELSYSQKPKIASVRKDAYDRSPKNFSGLDDSRNIQSLKEDIQSPELQMQSNNTSEKEEKVSSQKPLNRTKTFTTPGEFNETNTLPPRNSSTDTGETNEPHFAKHPKLEENETREISDASEREKTRTDSNTVADSIELCDPDEDYLTKMQSESPSYKAENGSSQQPMNSTKNSTMPGESNEINGLQLRNRSTDIESKSDRGEPNEPHFDKHPKPEEKETRGISSAYAPEGEKILTDSNTDADYTESCDPDEDHLIEMQSEDPSSKVEKGSSQKPLKSTKSSTMSGESNETKRLQPQNSSTEIESKTDTDEPNEPHFDKHPKLEEKDTREISNASEGAKIRANRKAADADSSESSDSDTDHRNKKPSESPSYKVEKGSSEQPLNSTKSSTMQGESKETNRLQPRNSSTYAESKSDRGESNELHFVKHPKLEEKETREISNASEGAKIRADKKADADSSESSDSNADHRIKKPSESPSYKVEKGSSQQPLNSTKSSTMLEESKETNRLQPQNNSTNPESKNDTDIPSEQHPKLEEKESREFSNASQESKLQTDSDTDSDSKNDTDIPSEQHPKLEEKESREFSNASQEPKLQTDSDTDSDSKNDTDIPSEQYPKLEEKESREFSNASQESKLQTDSDTDSDSKNDTDIPSEQYPKLEEKESREFSNESQKPKLQTDSDTDLDSENDTDIPSEQHPKLEEKESREFSNASQESKLQTDSDTDSDSSEYNDSDSSEYSDSDSSEYNDSDSSEYSDSDSSEYNDLEELYDYFEYDYEDEQLMSNFENYFTETFSNATTQSPENFTPPSTNYSVEIESPTSSRNDSKINTPPKTEGPYNSILEFLYNYSNSTWIEKLKEENRGM